MIFNGCTSIVFISLIDLISNIGKKIFYSCCLIEDFFKILICWILHGQFRIGHLNRFIGKQINRSFKRSQFRNCVCVDSYFRDISSYTIH